MKDELGDRMKAYEAVEAKRRLDTSVPVVARIDGRSFSKFTRPFVKPFDARLTSAMDEATKFLVEQTHANIGYTQSDEITLAWYVDRSENPEAQMLFDGRTQKLCSVLAGMATSAFIADLVKQEDNTRTLALRKLPHFDCRVWNVPTPEEAANTVFWRFLDARKNAVSSFTRQYISHKAMQGLNSLEQLDAAKAAGSPDFETAVSHGERYGRAFQRRTSLRMLTDAEWLAIPEKHRPPREQLLQRSEIVDIGTYWYGVTNLADVFFYQSDPVISRQ